MKSKYLFYAVFCSGLLFAEDTQPEYIRNHRVLAYGNFPLGLGLGLRSTGGKWNYEFNGATNLFSISGTFNFYYSIGSKNRWYTGVGTGAIMDFEGSYLPILPVTLGYWGEKGFWDFSLSFHPAMVELPPLPALRMGFHF